MRVSGRPARFFPLSDREFTSANEPETMGGDTMMKRTDVAGYLRAVLVALAGGATYLIAIATLMMPVVRVLAAL